MKKRLLAIISCLLIFAVCFTIFASCIKLDDDTVDVEFQKFVRGQNTIKSTPEPYKLPTQIDTWDSKGEEAVIYVDWKIESSTTDLVVLQEIDGKLWVNFPNERQTTIEYTLTATFVNVNGKAYLDSRKKPYVATFERAVPVSSGEVDPGGDDNNGGGNGGDSAATPAATLSLIGITTRTSYSTSQIVHKDNGITYTNDQANATSSCYDNSGDSRSTWATRAYASSTIKIEYTSAMTAIVITMDDGTYNGKQYMSGFDGMSVEGATITRDNDKVTIVLSAPTSSFQSAELASQCRIKGVEVYTNGVPSTGDTGGSGGTGGNGGTTGGDTSGQTGAFDFNFETNFSAYASSWTNQYSSQTVTASALGVSNASVSFNFTNVSKQTGTITNMPVVASKGVEQYVTATATGNTITSVTFNLTEWVPGGNGAAKTFTTLTLQYSVNGNDWVDTNVGLVNGTASPVSDYPTLTCSNLPIGVIAVRLVIVGNSSASGNQQVGISSCSLVLA